MVCYLRTLRPRRRAETGLEREIANCGRCQFPEVPNVMSLNVRRYRRQRQHVKVDKGHNCHNSWLAYGSKDPGQHPTPGRPGRQGLPLVSIAIANCESSRSACYGSSNMLSTTSNAPVWFVPSLSKWAAKERSQILHQRKCQKIW